MESARNDAVASSVAGRRWKILRRAVVNAARSESIDENEDLVSVRRFSSFGLFRVQPATDPLTHTNDVDGPPREKKKKKKNADDYDSWFDYRLKNDDRSFIKICLRSSKAKLRDLANFGDVDDTGNVCVWPAEEVLAHYLALRPTLVRDKVVVELGGGMTCLAGLVAAKWAGAKRVVMTDGNVKAAENVRRILVANRLDDNDDRTKAEKEPDESPPSSPSGSVDDARYVVTGGTNPLPLPPFTSRVLRWDAVDDHAPDLHHAVDLVVAADCLFFDPFRQSLVDALEFLLIPSDGASALIFAPRRKSTMEDFVRRAEAKGFAVAIEEDYDEIVSRKLVEAKKSEGNSFDEDIHYPLLLKVRRGGM